MIILNYANPDMVGHTGDFKAAVKAIQTVDAGLGTYCKGYIRGWRTAFSYRRSW